MYCEAGGRERTEKNHTTSSLIVGEASPRSSTQTFGMEDQVEIMRSSIVEGSDGRRGNVLISALMLEVESRQTVEFVCLVRSLNTRIQQLI